MAKEDTIEQFLSKVSDAIPDDAVQSSVLKLVDGFLKTTIDSLKVKNTELIAKNKKLASAMPEGLDSESIKSMIEELKGKSLQDYGDNIRAETADQLNTLSTQLSESELQRQKLDSDYQSTLINLELRSAAERARIRPEAINDFVEVHRKNFEIKDGAAISGELSTQDYVAGVLKNQDYWMPSSQGTGATGSRPNRGMVRNPDLALQAAAQSGDMDTYRKLREKV